jgi:hypothetical protein
MLEDWLGLVPENAHRCIAILAREGLIREVLTTNYDCLLENAFLDTFQPPISAINERMVIIRDLRSFREHGAAILTKQKYPVFRVFKLCGSVEQQEKDDSPKTPVIVTERDLQDWGEQYWARDLVHDRVRSYSLLFIGFDSRDPMFRHHAIQVIEEFKGNQDDKSLTDDSIWGLNNAPFIVAYEQLSFYQSQVMLTYARSHLEDRAWKDSKDLFDCLHENVFRASDCKDLGIDRRQLDANNFLDELMVLTLCRMVRDDYLQYPNSQILGYLKSVLRNPTQILDAVVSGLIDSQDRILYGWLTRNDEGIRPWFEIVRAFKRLGSNTARYHPFLESPIKLPMILVLTYLLCSSTNENNEIKEPDPTGNLVRISCTGRDNRPVNVYLFDYDKEYEVLNQLRRHSHVENWSILVRVGAGSVPNKVENLSVSRGLQKIGLSKHITLVSDHILLLSGDNSPSLSRVRSGIRQAVIDPDRLRPKKSRFMEQLERYFKKG